MGTTQQFSLRWNNYSSHISGAFSSLRNDEDLVDVTLSCDGRKIKAHKMLLSACSSYFKELFRDNPCQHPVVIFRNVRFEDLVAIVDFMYKGEVNVVEEQLSSFLTTAELLAVQGLSDGKESTENDSLIEIPDSPPTKVKPQSDFQLTKSNQNKKLFSKAVSPSVSFSPIEQQQTNFPASKRLKKSLSSSVSESPKSVKMKNDSQTNNNIERFNTFAVFPKNEDNVELVDVEEVPNVKLEVPEYEDPLDDGSSCSYSDSNQGLGRSGPITIRETIQSVTQLSSHSAVNSGKVELSDGYQSNSTDLTIPGSGEIISSPEFSHMLSKPGTSGDKQSHETPADTQWVTDTEWLEDEINSWASEPSQDAYPQMFSCKLCGKNFKSRSSLSKHKDVHRGTTCCPVCNTVLSRAAYLKQHMTVVHGISSQ